MKGLCWFLFDNDGKWLLLKNIKARVQKPYPIYDQNGRNKLKSIPYLWPKRLKNPTLWGRTYLYSPYKGVPPPGWEPANISDLKIELGNSEISNIPVKAFQALQLTWAFSWDFLQCLLLLGMPYHILKKAKVVKKLNSDFYMYFLVLLLQPLKAYLGSFTYMYIFQGQQHS